MTHMHKVNIRSFIAASRSVVIRRVDKHLRLFIIVTKNPRKYTKKRRMQNE
jgi:hypothetical protein